MNFGSIFLSEMLGTGVLTLLGVGVVANVLLVKSKGFDGGWLLINFGWGLGVFGGVYVANKTGGHLNPAVTIGTLFSGADEYADGVAVTVSSTIAYLGGELVGAFLGACAAYLAYKKHFDADPDAAKKLGIFATVPEIRSYGWNFVTEVIATFVLVLVIIGIGKAPADLGPLPAALLVLGIGASLGGPTGYAINPARDLGPRLAHAVLPVHRAARAPVPAGAAPAEPTPEAPPKNNDWAYAWIPVLGPLVGGALAGLVSAAFF